MVVSAHLYAGLKPNAERAKPWRARNPAPEGLCALSLVLQRQRRVYDAEGSVIRHDTFVSKYAPRRALYHYGPGYELPEE